MVGHDVRSFHPGQVGAGFAGGALSGVVCAPMELVMIQQQRSGGSLLGTAGRVVREHGAGTLFRGASVRASLGIGLGLGLGLG